MKSKIQRSLVLILFVTLFLFYAILAVILYNRNMSILEDEVRQEAKYIQAAINISGTDYLEQMAGCRIRWAERCIIMLSFWMTVLSSGLQDLWTG